MQLLPLFATQPPYPARCGSDCQRYQQYECGKSHRDVLPLRYIQQDFVQVEELIKPKVSREVRAAIEERKQSKHAPELDQRRHTQEFAKRRDAQCNQEKPKRPVAEPVLKCLNRSRAQADSPSVHIERMRPKKLLQQHHERYKAEKKNGDFDVTNHRRQLLALSFWPLDSRTANRVSQFLESDQACFDLQADFSSRWG